MPDRQIVACGGFLLGSPIQEYVLGLARGPHALYVPTASMENANLVLAFYQSMRGRCEADHLVFNPYPPEDLRAYASKYIVGKPRVTGVVLSPDTRRALKLTEAELAATGAVQ